MTNRHGHDIPGGVKGLEIDTRGIDFLYRIPVVIFLVDLHVLLCCANGSVQREGE